MALSVQFDPSSQRYAIVHCQTTEAALYIYNQLFHSGFDDNDIRYWQFKSVRKLNDIVRKHNGIAKEFGGHSWGCTHQWKWYFNTRSDAEAALENIEALILANKLSCKLDKEII